MSKFSKIAEVAHEKFALSQPGRNFLGALATGAGLTLGGVGVASAIGYGGTVLAKGRMHKAFEAMLGVHPKLRMEDPQKVEQYFKTLWNFAPDLAADPLMAGGVVTQAIRMDYTGAPPTELIKTVVDIQKSHKETQNKYMGSALGNFLIGAGQGHMINSEHSPFYSGE